ncbi:MAG: lamin tail domain-containing protein, partial [Nanoarchaeota archaeon]|nr:lamin tail domain-containing protein [Nanoarchaeota archaeon]
MKKILLLPIIFVLVMTSAMAVWSNQVNFDFIDNTTETVMSPSLMAQSKLLVYTCGSDLTCNAPTFWREFNATHSEWNAAGSRAEITLPATEGPSYYAYYFYVPTFVPVHGRTNESENWTTAAELDIEFNRIKNASALINQIAVFPTQFVNEPIAVSMFTNASAEIYSAFTSNGFVPYFNPAISDIAYQAELRDFYSAATNYTISFINTTDNTVVEGPFEYEIPNGIFMDETERVIYNSWQPTVEGEYTIEFTTEVTDSKVESLSTETHTASKQITVLPARAITQCYAQLSGLEWTPLSPGTNQEIDFTVDKLSNWVNDTYSNIDAIDMNATWTVTGPSPTYSETITIPANTGSFETGTAEPFTFNWTPTVAGQHTITVTGLPIDTVCSALANPTISDTVINTFDVEEAAFNFPPQISESPESPLVIEPGTLQEFNATIVDPEGNDMNVYWYLDSVLAQTNLDMASGSLVTGLELFDTAGIYNVTVRVVDDSNNHATFEWEVIVSGAPVISNPEPATPLSIGRKGQIDFNATVEDPEGEDLEVTWEVTDGSTSTTTTPVTLVSGSLAELNDEQFDVAGDWNVTLVVNDGSSTTNYTWEITVSECVVPYVGLQIDEDVTFCTDAYTLSDASYVMEIVADNVVVYGNDSFFDGSDLGTLFYSVGTYENVTLRNMSIDNYEDPLEFYDVSFLTIEDIELSDSEDEPIRVEDSNNLYINRVTIDSDDDGIVLYNVTDVLIENVQLSAIDEGIVMVLCTDNVTIRNIVVDSPDYGFFVENSFVTIYDSIIQNIFDADFEMDNGAIVYAVNTTFDEDNVLIGDDSELYKQWYFNAHVVDTLGNNVSGAIVNLTDINTNQVFSLITDVEGVIPTQAISELMINETGTFGFNNHTLNVTALGFDAYGEEYNVSENINANVVLTTTNYAPSISDYNPTTQEFNLLTGDSQLFNVTVEDPEGENMTVEWYVDGILNETDSDVENNTIADFTYNDFSVEGEYIINVVVIDSIGLTDTYEWNVTVSDVPVNQDPVITEHNPVDADFEINTGDSQLFNVTVEDPEGENMTVYWYVDGTLNETDSDVENNTIADFTYNDFSVAGEYNVTVIVEDNESNNVSYEWNVTVSNVVTPVNVVFSEIMYDAAIEWVEVYNAEVSEINMSGWEFYENNNNLLTAVTTSILPAGGYAILTENEVAFMGQYPGYTGLIFTYSSTGGLDNGGETIRLYGEDGTLVDNVSYGDTAPWPTTVTTGYSIELTDMALDNNEGANWNVSADINGTPGTGPANQAPTITLTTPVTPLTLNVDDTQLFNATFTDAEGSNMTVTW